MDEEAYVRQRHHSQPTAPPPSYEECVSRSTEREVPGSLSHDEARKALLRYVNQGWFVSKSPAIEFSFVSIQTSSAYRYELETYTESRSVSWAYEPYTGQRLDTPQNGPEQDVSSVQVSPPAMFVENEIKREMPHTASQITCHDCHGATHCQCWKCKGSGGVYCTTCSGDGQVPRLATPPSSPYQSQSHSSTIRDQVTCGLCKGAGTESCSACKGKGQILCETCSGAGRLKKFRELTVTWKIHSVDRIVELTGLNHECIRKAKATILLQEESLQAEPIQDFHIPSMRLASTELIPYSIYPNSKKLMQRQTVYLVPVHLVTAQWKEKQFCYWVYGYDNAAHCTEYPGNKCDCNCTLL